MKKISVIVIWLITGIFGGHWLYLRRIDKFLISIGLLVLGPIAEDSVSETAGSLVFGLILLNWLYGLYWLGKTDTSDLVLDAKESVGREIKDGNKKIKGKTKSTMIKEIFPEVDSATIHEDGDLIVSLEVPINELGEKEDIIHFEGKMEISVKKLKLESEISSNAMVKAETLNVRSGWLQIDGVAEEKFSINGKLDILKFSNPDVIAYTIGKKKSGVVESKIKNKDFKIEKISYEIDSDDDLQLTVETTGKTPYFVGVGVYKDEEEVDATVERIDDETGSTSKYIYSVEAGENINIAIYDCQVIGKNVEFSIQGKAERIEAEEEHNEEDENSDLKEQLGYLDKTNTEENMVFAEYIDIIIDDYKADPRNKVFIDERTLLAAANEETGNDISIGQLRIAINNFLTGEMEDDDYPIYDGAIYACAVAANNCFGDPGEHQDDDDYSVDYQIDWIKNSDGSFTAEIRPTSASN